MFSRRFLLQGLLSPRWVVRFLILFSTLYVFLWLNEVYSYKPFPRGAIKAAEMSFTAHLGFWLATIDWRGHWRFLGALLAIPSIVGVYLLVWHRNFVTLGIFFVVTIWLMRKVLLGWQNNSKSV
jgi:hypothetical protein